MKKLIIISFSVIIVMLFSFFSIRTKMKKEEIPSVNGFAVVELFTSEGCSSCPAADEAVIQLAKDYPSNVYILGYHVDYWNYIGWKDEYSSAAFTERQKKYAERFTLSSIYTPQIVVNGQKEFVGSNKGLLKSTVSKALDINAPGNVKLTITKQDDKTINVTYEANATESSLLNIALVQSNATTAVKRGENKGKSLHHINIVRGLKSFPVDKNAKAVIAFPLPADLSLRDVEVVAFLQDKKELKITGAVAASIE